MAISAEGGQASFETRLQANNTSYHVPNNSFQLKMDLAGVIYFLQSEKFLLGT